MMEPVFTIPQVNDTDWVRRMFRSLYAKWLMTTADVSRPPMFEIIGATFVADEDHIFGKPNDEYIQRELEWYEGMSLNVNDIPGGPPKIWRDIAVPPYFEGDPRGNELGRLRAGTINSNYGFLLYHKENGYQYNNVIEKLLDDPRTRQAVAVYTRPTIHDDAVRDGMHDFICTNTVQYFIRDDMVSAIVNMRSNDAVFGYRNDYAWQLYVLKNIASEVGVGVGEIIWQIGNLHVYPRHADLIKTYAETGEHNVRL